MKKILFAMVVAAFGAAFGAANDTVLVFSTKGPDTYGDGTRVLDGERYALVWVKDGTTFAGLTADCKSCSETTKLLAVAPFAKGGKCPETVFEIDADFAETLKGGSFALFLLDTRVSKTVLAKAEKLSVNVAGLASTSTSTFSTSQPSTSVDLATVGVYSKIDEPKIMALKVEGATIELKVSGMSAAADYFVVHGTTPGDVGEKLETTVVDHETLKAAKPESDAGFFKVLGVRAFE